MLWPAVGDRVRITGIMPDDPSPLEIGATGTVTGVRYQAISQIDVKWDNGRNLILLPNDPFEIISRAAETASHDHPADPSAGGTP
ncbi:DUF4314 domain-containing protein [Nocardia abscessus]|uniref:DUF4314 domain-containing protein n=1 Tax=Nocardia abscessus TaxID=120957 RepID=UPI002456721A|nr:DUF4314 domain-containing protein [Nocardia abscessus]